MVDSGLRYFTHEIDGAMYGAWYRIVTSTQIEVIGIGMLERGEYAGFSPESSAKSILENFVRLRARMGAPVPSLSALDPPTDEPEDMASVPQPQTTRQPRSRA